MPKTSTPLAIPNGEMGRTMITTPDGHEACLRVEMGQQSTSVSAICGTVRVSRDSATLNDVALIPQVITDLDNLITNLGDYAPKVEKGSSYM